MVQVKGNGNMVSKSYPISSFLRLHIAVRGTTELIQSEEEKVEVEMDENLLEHFEVQNMGRTLYVSTEGKLRTPLFTKAIVRIYFRQLDQLVIRCEGGDVVSPGQIRLSSPLDLKVQSIGMVNLNIAAPQLKVVLQSEGDCILAGECVLVHIKNQSEGHLFGKELHAQELVLRNQAEGNVEVYSEQKISIFHSGTGNVHYYGEGKLVEVRNHGHGDVRHM